jgi:hypothetical protein
VLEHLFDIRAALSEVSQLVKDHGFFVLTTPYDGLCKDLVISLLRFEQHFDVLGLHIRFFTQQSLPACLSLPDLRPGSGREWVEPGLSISPSLLSHRSVRPYETIYVSSQLHLRIKS